MALKTKPIYLNSFLGEAPKTINDNFENIKNYFDSFYNQDNKTLSSTFLNSTNINSTNGQINSLNVDYLTVKQKLYYANFIDPNDFWQSFNLATLNIETKEIISTTSMDVNNFIDSIVIKNENAENINISVKVNEQEILSKNVNSNSVLNITSFSDYSLPLIDSNSTIVTNVPLVITINGNDLTKNVNISINLKKIVNN